MTVAAVKPDIEYVENGSTVNFAVPWRYRDPLHLVVERIDAAGVVTLLAIGTDYTATDGDTDAGGTLTVTAPAVSGTRLRIRRETPRNQDTDYITTGAFKAESHEDTMDELAMIAQELDVRADDLADRAFLVPDGEAPTDLPAAADRALLYFAFNAQGNPVALGATNETVEFQLALRKLAVSPQHDLGAISDGVADDAAEIQAAIDLRDLAQIDAEHMVESTLDVGFDQSLIGFSRKGVLRAGTALTNDILIRNNSNADGTAWINQYPNNVASVFDGLSLDAEARRAAGLKTLGVAFGGSAIFRNMRLAGVSQGFKAVGIYNDKPRFEGVHFVDGIQEQATNERLIQLGLGDGVTLSGVGFPQFARQIADPNNRLLVNGLYTFANAGLVADGLINGYNKFERSHAVVVNGGHFESGGVEFKDSTGQVNGCVFWARANASVVDGGQTYNYLDFEISPIRAIGEAAGSLYCGAVSYRDCVVTYWRNWNGGYPTGAYDIHQVGDQALHLTDGARRAGSTNTAVAPTTLLGMRAWDGTDPIDSFNNYSHIASRHSRLRNAQLELTADLPPMVAGNGLGTGIGTDSRSTWQLATGTWFFRSQVLYDKVRLAGYEGSAERSVALTNAGAGARIQLSGPNFPHIQRIYFGTATGDYQYYVDVPVIGGSFVYLDGLDCEGFAVVDRGAPSAMDPINTFVDGYKLSPGDNGASAYGVATLRDNGTPVAPTVGAWAEGDQIIGGGRTWTYDGAAWSLECADWELVGEVDFSGGGAAETGEITGLEIYRELLIEVEDVAAAAAAVRRLRIANAGGAYLTSNYIHYSETGDGTISSVGALAFHATGSADPRSCVVHIKNNQAAVKQYDVQGWQGGGRFAANGNPVGAVQLSLTSGGINMNAGVLRVRGR